MRLILKILLVVVVIAATIFFTGIFIYTIILKKLVFETEMLFVVAVSILGFLSAWFQVKTIKLYRLDKQGKVLPTPSKVFWAFNVGFAGAIITLFAWSFYNAFIRFDYEIIFNSSEVFQILLVFSIPISIGGFIFFESYYLKRMLKKNEGRKLILEIDDIKGEEQN